LRCINGIEPIDDAAGRVEAIREANPILELARQPRRNIFEQNFVFYKKKNSLILSENFKNNLKC
jgi:hypothetical protein